MEDAGFLKRDDQSRPWLDLELYELGSAPLPKRAIRSSPVVQSMIQSPTSARRRVSPIGASRPANRSAVSAPNLRAACRRSRARSAARPCSIPRCDALRPSFGAVFVLPRPNPHREVFLEVARLVQSIHLRHVSYLQVQTNPPSRHLLRPQQHHFPQRSELRCPQAPVQRRHLPRNAARRRVLQGRQQRRRVVVPQIVGRDPQGVKRQVALAREQRIGSRCDACLPAAGARGARGHQVDDPRRRTPRRRPGVEHDRQHRRQPVGGPEPLAPPAFDVEVVDVVADAHGRAFISSALSLRSVQGSQPGMGLPSFNSQGRQSAPGAPCRRHGSYRRLRDTAATGDRSRSLAPPRSRR